MTDNDPIEIFRGEPTLYTLKELARMKALAASRLANSLMSAETPDFVAWPKAIREAILEEDSA